MSLDGEQFLDLQGPDAQVVRWATIASYVLAGGSATGDTTGDLDPDLRDFLTQDTQAFSRERRVRLQRQEQESKTRAQVPPPREPWRGPPGDGKGGLRRCDVI